MASKMTETSGNTNIFKTIGKPHYFRTRQIFKLIPKSDLTAIIFSISGTMFNNDFFRHPTVICKVGIVAYFIFLIIASYTNYIIQNTLILTAEKFQFNSFAETTSYLNHMTLVKIIPFFYLLISFTKCVSNLTSITQSVNHLILVYGVRKELFVTKESFIWTLIIPLIFIYLLYYKQTLFFKYLYFSSILSILAIIVFLANELIKKYRDGTMIVGSHKLFVWKELVPSYFYLMATTSLKGQLFSIYKGLLFKNSKFMTKFISISMVLCFSIYPIYALLGYSLFRDKENSLHDKSFVEVYYAKNLVNHNVLFDIILILRFFINLTIFCTNFLSIRNFLSRYFFVKKNVSYPKVNYRIEQVNKKIKFFLHIVTFTALISMTCLFIFRGKSVGTITKFNVAFFYPLLYSIIPLMIRYKYEKSLKIKLLFFILIVFYGSGIIIYFTNL